MHSSWFWEKGDVTIEMEVLKEVGEEGGEYIRAIWNRESHSNFDVPANKKKAPPEGRQKYWEAEMKKGRPHIGTHYKWPRVGTRGREMQHERRERIEAWIQAVWWRRWRWRWRWSGLSHG